jgi:hypothetical protein
MVGTERARPVKSGRNDFLTRVGEAARVLTFANLPRSPSATRADAELAKSLWNLSNIVTGLAVLQSLGFVIAIVSDQENLKWFQTVVEEHWVLMVLIEAIYVLPLIYAVVVIHNLAVTLLETENHVSVWGAVRRLRVLAILLFALLIPLTMFADKLA